jgi:hypothetical protein
MLQTAGLEAKPIKPASWYAIRTVLAGFSLSVTERAAR